MQSQGYAVCGSPEQETALASLCNDGQTVFIVDDDEAVRDSLVELLHSVGLHAEAFDSAQSFLTDCSQRRPACLLLDVRLPGMSGLQLQDRLLDQGTDMPIVFITAHGDLPMAVEALKKGAHDFVEKPLGGRDILSKVEAALAADAERQQRQAQTAVLRERLARLSARERQILNLLAAGESPKRIGYLLGISIKTVYFHRANLLEKLQAASLPSLVLRLQRSGLQ